MCKGRVELQVKHEKSTYDLMVCQTCGDFEVKQKKVPSKGRKDMHVFELQLGVFGRALLYGLGLLSSGLNSDGTYFPIVKQDEDVPEIDGLHAALAAATPKKTLTQCVDFYNSCVQTYNKGKKEPIVCWWLHGQDVVLGQLTKWGFIGRRNLEYEEKMPEYQLVGKEYGLPEAVHPKDINPGVLAAWLGNGNLFTLQDFLQGALGSHVKGVETLERAISSMWVEGEQACMRARMRAMREEAEKPTEVHRKAAFNVLKRAWGATCEELGIANAPELKRLRRTSEEPTHRAEPKGPKTQFTMKCPACQEDVPVDKNERPFTCKQCDCGVLFCAHCGLTEAAHMSIAQGTSKEAIRKRKDYCKFARQNLLAQK